MLYHVIGTMSGSSMDGLDIVYCSLQESGGNWTYQINVADCIEFPDEWKKKLPGITALTAKELLRTHAAFGRWMGNAIKDFIAAHSLAHKVHLIASHGHTVFHEPAEGMTFQMGDGAAIAAITKLPVISDLRNMDIALGGQGAPIVPIGEKLFWNEYPYFLNIGGICNITIRAAGEQTAFDVCPANRVLNLLSNELGRTFDENGNEAASGHINDDLLYDLNTLDYYNKPFPKSLANEYGSDIVFNTIQKYDISAQDKLRTYCRHIAIQIAAVCPQNEESDFAKMLVTGGGAFNAHLIAEISDLLSAKQIEVEIPHADLVQYKEALIMALIGVLRWREEVNVINSVTGAARSSVGGALWMGQE